MDIRQFCDENFLTIEEFSSRRWMNVTKKTVWSWQNGLSLPKKSHIKKLLDISNGKIRYEDIVKTYKKRQAHEKKVESSD